jgi:hypothetical protein
VLKVPSIKYHQCNKAVQFGTVEETVERTPKTAPEAPFSAAHAARIKLSPSSCHSLIDRVNLGVKSTKSLAHDR